VSVLTGVSGGVDDIFDSDDSDSAVVSTTAASSSDISELNPQTLLELSSRAVAKHCSCSVLEKQSPPVDEGLLRRVRLSSLYVALTLVIGRQEWIGV